MKKLVIIPTYNEANNIGVVIKKIISLSIDDLDILVIDDNSPDKTYALVEDIIEKNSSVLLKKREKKMGLASAYISGFNYALKNQYDIIIQIDADLSHDPTEIPGFLTKLENYDFVTGSRYVKDGKIDNWGYLRKKISQLANVYARLVLGVKFKDLTSGYNAWKVSVLKTIDFNKIDSKGYVFQIELKYMATKKGFFYKEKPIVFKERLNDKSKFKLSIIIEAFLKVFKIKFKYK